MQVVMKCPSIWDIPRSKGNVIYTLRVEVEANEAISKKHIMNYHWLACCLARVHTPVSCSTDFLPEDGGDTFLRNVSEAMQHGK
jgi:hypothetical protein